MSRFSLFLTPQQNPHNRELQRVGAANECDKETKNYTQDFLQYPGPLHTQVLLPMKLVLLLVSMTPHTRGTTYLV